ncbi:MAG: hypothetical protein US89_C0002G0008 [Candidatus Peregrinibacteria bacterium GW2011_GWF2_38_29]|nr:MAG: hypothetical protein US89_C0002G0008 [Candidatus Peregrinibacteria bacterium GW2011_GWF2_38_29]HBB02164.1 hypothetical protein [Candidatus Peregrinibacteria bacterium]
MSQEYPHERYTDSTPKGDEVPGLEAFSGPLPADYSKDAVGVIGRSHETPALQFGYRETDSRTFQIQADIMRVADAVLTVSSPRGEIDITSPVSMLHVKEAIKTGTFDAICETVHDFVSHIAGRSVDNIEGVVKSLKFLIDGMKSGRTSYATINFMSSTGNMERLRFYPKSGKTPEVEVALVSPKDPDVKARFAACSGARPKTQPEE